MSGNKITALIIVAILHVIVGYALVTGLAYEAIKKVKEVTAAVNIEEEKPPEEPPPPPPEEKPLPPPPIDLPPPPKGLELPPQNNQQAPQPPPPPGPPPPPPPPPPPAPPPPPPKFPPKAASPKGNPGNWATTNDYPSRALREERAGTTGFRVTVGTDGKVIDCSVTRSSGSPDLDEATCSNVRRRARFNPATDGNGQPTTGVYSSSVRWVIPKD
jgi:protein TonB